MSVQQEDAIHEIVERASDFEILKSPLGSVVAEGLEDGALVAGGAYDLFDKKHIGLLANYAAVGVIYGAFPRTVYPFLNNYLNMDGYQAVAAYTLVSLPWSFKTVIGIVSDSFPICGYRRKPYIMIGWSLCFLMLLIMALMPVDEPFYRFYEDREKDLSTISKERLNLDAPDQGAKYILLMMFASLFYVISDVCCDGVMVEFAQREAERVRGHTQTMVYLIRTLFSIFSVTLIGFCMNSHDYGGAFSWSLEFNEIMGILSIAAAAVVPVTYWFMEEQRVLRESFKSRLGEMWKMCQQRVIWQIMALKFLLGAFGSFGAAPTNIVQREWAGVTPLNDSIFTVVGYVVFAMTLYATKVWGLNWDWRRTIAVTTILSILIDGVVSFLTIFDIYRNQWFWLGVPILEELPVGVRFIVSTFIVVEISDEGYEAATYGLITTVSNLATPFASSIYKNVDAYFNAFQEDIKRDDADARMQVAWTFIIMYIVKLVGLVWLILLPRQKKEAQELKRNGGSSKIGGAVALAVSLFALIFSIATNLMSIYPSTACLKVAGGRGC